MSGSNRLIEGQKAGERHSEWWVDLNSEIREGFPEKVSFEHRPAGSQGESCVYIIPQDIHTS